MTDPGDTVRLVTRGDDAGLAPGANDAIRRCFESGILRNVSVMSPGPALDHAADRLTGLDGLCVGVHLTLTAEWDRPNWGPVLPAGEVPSLVDDEGHLARGAEDLVERQPERNEVVAEMEAQIDRIRAVGFEPGYLDTHMALERWDRFAEALEAVCDRQELIDGTAVPLLPGAEGAGSGPDWLLDRLSDVDPGTYLVVGHPGDETDEMARIVGPGWDRGEVASARAAQRRMFAAERVREYLDTRGIEPVRYVQM